MSRDREQQKITPDQASYVLHRLLQSGRIAPSEVDALLSEMRAEISELETRLTRLKSTLRAL